MLNIYKKKTKKKQKKNKTVMTLWLAGSIIKTCGNFRNIACKYVNYKCILNENT